jgi:hypothetical protein
MSGRPCTGYVWDVVCKVDLVGCVCLLAMVLGLMEAKKAMDKEEKPRKKQKVIDLGEKVIDLDEEWEVLAQTRQQQSDIINNNNNKNQQHTHTPSPATQQAKQIKKEMREYMQSKNTREDQVLVAIFKAAKQH